MKQFEYIKINGAGNDFVLIDEKDNPGIKLTNSEIAKICDRETGIGADGVLIIYDDKESDFEMKYFNSDGSSGSLCGNGARCAVKYAQISNRINSLQTEFINEGVRYSAEIISEYVIRFDLKPPGKIKTNYKVKALGQLITAHFADTGSPHVIIDINDILVNPENPRNVFTNLMDFPVEEAGKTIRQLDEFKPTGVNVNFIKKELDYIGIRSFEKGVEAETLACGTGAAAAGIIANIIYKKNPPIKFITKSNAELIVNFKVENGSFRNLSLTGPVEIEHKGNYSI